MPDFSILNTITAATINKKLLNALIKKMFGEKLEMVPTARFSINRFISISSNNISGFLFNYFIPATDLIDTTP